MSNSSSGALVIGGDFQGLGTLLSLSKRGIPTYLIDSELSIGRFSRQKDKFLRCPDLKNENTFLNFLKKLAHEENLWGWVVFANDDETIRFLSQHKEELEKFYKIPVPDWSIINNIYNKILTYQLAREIDVATPRTFYPKNIGSLSQLNLEFPVIIKPAIRDHFYKKTKVKAVKALNMEQLLKGYQRVCTIIDPSEVVIQELIPGKASNLYSLGAFFKDGKMLAKVIAKRSRQHPMEFGHATTYAETVNIPILEDLGTKLLKALNYYGLAEVEFMYDPRDGQYKFIEVNGRVWGWHTLAGAAGVDLPYLLYRDLMGKKISTNGSFTEGVKWIRPITDIPTAFLELVRGRMRLRDYFSSLKGKKEFAPNLSLHDPLPFLMEFILLPYLWKKRGF